MKKINIGLTFYGGVSLAVYEAGVAEEFLRFIQFCKENKGKYSKDDKFDINIEVVSGASAGGLAAVLMSAALVNSNDPSEHIQEMRRIWFDVADLSALQYKFGQNVISLLNNDVLEKEIDKFLQIKGEKGLCDDLKILITATNMQGFFDAIPIEHDFTDKNVFAEKAFPTFRHTEVFEFTNDEINQACKDEEKEIRKKITKAARITSSFPAAFPPQFVQSPSFHEDTLNWYKQEKGKNNKPLHFWFFDGGVLDNKPLGHAIDYIQSSKKEGDWWYFFVEPRPQDYKPKHPEWGIDPFNPPDPVATIMSVFDARGEETIYYDLKRIQNINHQVMQINKLIEIIYPQILKSPDLMGDVIKSLLDSVSTARVHRFLPDYLKCITMIRYRTKIREKEIDEFSKLVIENICPLDFRNIINEMEIDEKEYIKAISDIKEKVARNHEFIEAFKKFDEASEETMKAQLLFRQITFWVESDFKGNESKEKGKILDNTWRAFDEAKKELEKSLPILKQRFDELLTVIKGLLNDMKMYREIELFLLLSEAVHSAAGVETREKINVVKIYHDTIKPLAGAKIANFAGFLDRRWRKNDYKMGIEDAREMLQGKMKNGFFNKPFWDEYAKWRLDSEDGFTDAYRLTKDDILEDAYMQIENLPADKVIFNANGIIKALEKLIGKHQEKTVYKLLKTVKIHLILPFVRFVLWLIKQATSQPSCNNKSTAFTATKKVFAQGKRYFGFLFIGVFLGLLISFFLPDIIRDNVPLIWNKIISVLGIKITLILTGVLIVLFLKRDFFKRLLRGMWKRAISGFGK